MSPPTQLDLAFDWSDLTLAGTLHLPDGAGPHPAVLMLQGSGPADRDGGGYFTPIRQAFIDRGIATFAFDKPGCGDSSGDWRRYGLEGRADQATACFSFMRTHPSIDRERVGVWGQSQGGWLVQLLASRVADLAFAIANSGPSINVPRQDLYGCEHTMRSQGFPEQEISEALTFIRHVHQAAQAKEDFATLEAGLLREVEKKPWYGSYLTVEDEDDWGLVQLFVGEQYEPLEAMKQIRCPFLSIYGGRDVLVPAWTGAEESGKALQEAGTKDSTVVVFPDGNHRIQDADTGRFVDGYLDLLGDWAARRVGPGSNG